jgi:hypothetical protein
LHPNLVASRQGNKHRCETKEPSEGENEEVGLVAWGVIHKEKRRNSTPLLLYSEGCHGNDTALKTDLGSVKGLANVTAADAADGRREDVPRHGPRVGNGRLRHSQNGSHVNLTAMETTRIKPKHKRVVEHK